MILIYFKVKISRTTVFAPLTTGHLGKHHSLTVPCLHSISNYSGDDDNAVGFGNHCDFFLLIVFVRTGNQRDHIFFFKSNLFQHSLKENHKYI